MEGAGNEYDFGARIYDPRLGRFLSLDPWVSKYPDLSPYIFAADNPIRLIDVVGKGPGDVIKIKEATSAFNTDKKFQSASITLYVDQPGEGKDRDAIETNGFMHDVGHTFMKISVAYEDGSITERIIGFYPETSVSPDSPKSPGEFKNDEGHSYDVSKTYPVTESQVKSVIEFLNSKDKGEYDLNTCNCATLAVDAVKKGGGNVPETIPKEWSGTLLGVKTITDKGGGLNPGDLGEDLRKQEGTVTEPGVATTTKAAPANSKNDQPKVEKKIEP